MMESEHKRQFKEAFKKYLKAEEEEKVVKNLVYQTEGMIGTVLNVQTK